MTDEVDLLAGENRRLREQVHELHDRVSAFERSRWWRLHPRRLVRRRGSVVGESDDTHEAAAEAHHGSAVTSDVVVRFSEEVVSLGEFTQDWLTVKLPALDAVIAQIGPMTEEVLEIGSYEGLSACYFLWRMPTARVTCVDTFGSSLEHETKVPRAELEARFAENVELVDASRVRPIVGDSRRVLLDLIDAGESFDLIYVDGSHVALDVLVDAALSWRLLRKGGILVFDDYVWRELGDDPMLRPGAAIDALLQVLEGKYAVLMDGVQLALRKHP